MSGARRFEDLICWQEARQLASDLETWLRRDAIADRSYTDQLRRASVSVQVNIAEGFDRFTHGEFHRFLGIAKGSLAEVRALLIAALDRGMVDQTMYGNFTSQTERLAKRLTRLMQYLRQSNRGRKP